jgi:hypothetical protein
LLGPFALIAAPILALVPATRAIPAYRAAFAIGRVLLSLSGTGACVNSPAAVIHIRIF